jgi:uncharacterized protein DUF6867
MEAILGASWPVFIGITLILFGGASFLMGQALAETWRPVWQNVIYGAMLAMGDRYITFALFHTDLLSISGYLVHSVVLIAISLFAYRITRAHRMVTQYPWLYERTGLFSWREKSAP